jgi:monolysocardiolipin acyltransferase
VAKDGLKVPDLLPHNSNQNTIKMAADERPYEPPAVTRAIHNVTMGTVGALCRSFLYGLSRTEVHGLEAFQRLVDERSDPRRRERGLITGS